MKLAIMQPYIFPYIGYFQLIKSVDSFVFYNDVNFIKKGWINRNRILVNGLEFLFTIPCVNASQNKKIHEIEVAFEEKEKKKLLTTIATAYAKAPFFHAVFPIIESVFSASYNGIDEIAIASVKETCNYLSLKDVNFSESNGRYNNEELKGADRLIDICRQEKIEKYINPSGGMAIYSKNYFSERKIILDFLKSKIDAYDQNAADFISGLSIIDVMMFNDVEKINDFLNNYELV